jgi:transmembrane sensor
VLGGAIALERPNLFQDMRADVVSDRGERRTVDLPDGSTVLLDADSALAQRFANGERRVVLLRGGAYFSVVKAAQSFVVETSNGTVEVLGTKFDVRLSNDDTVVTVAQGRVAVTSPNRQRALLEPGQQVRFDKIGVGPVRSADLAASMAWHEGRFVFYQARFADVVGELQRYRPGRLVIASAALADSRVSGSFTLDDPDAALESLRSTVNFETYSILGRLTVLR